MISENDKSFLLKLARKAIQSKSQDNLLTEEEINNLNPLLKEKRGCFVTLNKNGNLRGCIGYILPVEPLYKAVMINAYNAAYGDPRFPKVDESEYNDLHIEISILTVPKKLEYESTQDILNKLTPLKDGVVIKKTFRSATFLPQVWEQLPQKEDFLSHLCLKAGLKPDEWVRSTLEIETYQVEAFEEEK